jgi:hypothetical protein
VECLGGYGEPDVGLWKWNERNAVSWLSNALQVVERASLTFIIFLRTSVRCIASTRLVPVCTAMTTDSY